MRGKILILAAAVLIMSQLAFADTRYVNSENGLRVRDKPGLDGKILDVLPFGTAVNLADDTDYGGWRMIWFGDELAYVCSEFTQDENPLRGMKHMGKWRITAYAYTGSPCANGNFPTAGYTVACNSLPFGTEIYIDGVGFRTVEDRGPSWLGSEWCDLYLGNTEDCIQWGNQYREVYVVEEDHPQQ